MNERGFAIAKGFEKADVQLPMRGTANSAGYDLRAADSGILESGEQRVFPTGLKAWMRPDEVLLVFPRSSMGIKRGLTLANTVGVIDSDYFENVENDGHIMVCLRNNGKEPQIIYKGDKIAQAIFVPFRTCGDMPEAVRQGGIGSTGK